MQWQRCVDLSDKAFSNMSRDRVIRVKYETFVNEPLQESIRILNSLNINYDLKEVRNSIKNVTNSNIGKGRSSLNKRKLQKISKLISKTLKKHGYKN